ncbi:MAG: VWA domain-containing protein [Candidatus Nealsonbacteria bacterium]|nr:VWA domain-containing protein [Candidatus Nealsonbacteria bacterium]
MSTNQRESECRGVYRMLLPAAAGLLLAAAATTASAAGMLIADGGLGGVLKIDQHEVRVTINNGIAVTDVTQTFRNTENRQVEALYLFPVPKGASVANFSMWIGGKEMIGEVVEKKRAREIYESYKRVRRDPGLLEQVDFKNFEMRIFPIGPQAEQKVQITYYQQLDYDHDWATYVYPLATAPRPGINSRTEGSFSLTLRVKSEVPLVALESPSHADDFVVVSHTDSYYEASLETKGGDLNRDVVLAYHVARPMTGIDVVASKAAGDDGYFMLTLTAGDELAADNPGMDYVFVLDVSGSMAYDGKLALSSQSIGAFIDGLGPDDRFDVVAFNVKLTTLFGGLRAADDAARDEAGQFLSSQQGRGGTILRTAMGMAYQYGEPDRPLNVVVLSDGMTEQAERRELLATIAQRPANAKVFCIGVGNEVNRPLLSQLAEEAGGLAAFLSRGDDFQRQAKAFRRKLTRPAAANVQIDFAGADVYDLEPKQLPNLYYGMPVRIYGRYRSAGPTDVRLRAEINGAPLDRTMQIDLPGSESGNTEVERMWASQKVDRLLKQANRDGSRSPVPPAAGDAVLDEIIRLGETYSIVTEYTSFIVLENDAEYRRWNIQRKNLSRTTRDRKQQQLVRSRLDAMREKALADLGPRPNATEQLADARTQSPDTADRDVATPQRQSTGNNDSGGTRRGPGFGGGGAIDPISGAIVLSLAGLGAAAARRRKSQRRKSRRRKS